MHGAQVLAALQDVAGKAVAQHVGVHGGGQACLQAAALKAVPHGLGGKAGAVFADEQGGLMRRHFDRLSANGTLLRPAGILQA